MGDVGLVRPKVGWPIKGNAKVCGLVPNRPRDHTLVIWNSTEWSCYFPSYGLAMDASRLQRHWRGRMPMNRKSKNRIECALDETENFVELLERLQSAHDAYIDRWGIVCRSRVNDQMWWQKRCLTCVWWNECLRMFNNAPVGSLALTTNISRPGQLIHMRVLCSEVLFFYSSLSLLGFHLFTSSDGPHSG